MAHKKTASENLRCSRVTELIFLEVWDGPGLPWKSGLQKSCPPHYRSTGIYQSLTWDLPYNWKSLCTWCISIRRARTHSPVLCNGWERSLPGWFGGCAFFTRGTNTSLVVQPGLWLCVLYFCTAHTNIPANWAMCRVTKWRGLRPH